MHDDSPPSPEAQAFLDAPRPAAPPLTEDTVWAYRAVIREETLPRSGRAVARHPVTIAEVEIGGVPCLTVTPGDRPPSGTALYCFGGGYFSGSAREDLILAAPLAAYSGRRIVMVDYRLAPEHPYPAALEDGLAVYRALSAEGAFALIGESAGGNLALALIQRCLSEGLTLPECVALLSPWCDLTPEAAARHNPEGVDPTLNPELIQGAARMFGGDHDLASPEISPVFADWPTGLPPCMITTGTRDLLRDQTVRLAELLRSSGARCDLRVHPHMWHVFEFYDEIPEADRSLREIGAFLVR